MTTKRRNDYIYYSDGSCRPDCYEPDFAMNSLLPVPHYTNNYWWEARTIWGQKSRELHYVYSDRLRQWDYTKAERCSKEARETCDHRTPAWVEKYLSLYYERPVKIKHILGGVNLSNGYEYYAYGFVYDE